MAEYGTSVASKAAPDKVWRIWSDMSTWGDWNPNVSTMDWSGGFVSGSWGIMNTRAGQHHKMQLLDVQSGRSFALETSVVPLTRFRFNCRIESAGGKTKVSVQWIPADSATEMERKTFDEGRDGMKQGWGGTMDQFAAYLGQAK